MKTWTLAVIAALAALVVVAGVGGYLLGTRAGRASANATRNRFLAERLGDQGRGGALGFPEGLQMAGAGGAGTAGTVKSVEEHTLIVTTARGEVTVRLADNTTVRKLTDGTLQDIQPGLRIIVAGEADASGVVMAESLQLVPATAD